MSYSTVKSRENHISLIFGQFISTKIVPEPQGYGREFDPVIPATAVGHSPVITERIRDIITHDISLLLIRMKDLKPNMIKS